MEREQLPIIQSICEGERTLQQRFPVLAQRLKSTADQPFLVAANADGPMQSVLISTPEWEGRVPGGGVARGWPPAIFG